MRSRLPEWARQQKFTIVARSPKDDPTNEDLRLMLRALLEDRFAVKAHRESHTAGVSLLVVAKEGVNGPALVPHNPARVCVPQGSAVTQELGKPAPVLCGLQITRKEGGTMHVSMVDVTLPEACTLLGGLGGVLGGRGMTRVVDSTGLTGHYDMTLDFQIEQADGPQSIDSAGGPSFTAALEKQLGLKLKKGTGEVEDLIIDHIAEPTAD